MTNLPFKLIPDKAGGLFIDVMYPGEDKPRYMIDLVKMECTCQGFIQHKKCYHITEVRERVKLS